MSNAIETAGLTVLEFLAPVLASLVASNNPKYAAVVNAGAQVAQQEVAGVLAGQPLTVHQLAPLAEVGIAAGATAIAANNQKDAASVASVGNALLQAVAALNVPTSTAAPGS